ncbi:MAG TPA: PAS domain S-box protein, partial [Thermoanaerobaculia bacterium]
MLAYPIRNESGVLAGFVALSIDLANYDRQMESLYAGPSMVVTILDSEGVVVARLPHAQRVSGQRSPEAPLALPAPAERSGTMVAAGRDGVERVYGFASIPTAGWRVYAGAPRDQVWAPVRALLLQSVLVILLVMAVVFVLGSRLVSRIIGPMERLALVTDEGASSAMSRRAGLTGPREVVRVARRFNEMLEIRERDEAAVRSSEARLSSIINSAMDAILAIDAHGTVVVFNPMAEQLFGVSSESAQGQPVGRFLMGGLSAPAASSSTAATGVNWTAVGIRANGEHFPFEATVSRVDGDRGEMTAIILRDVTERSRREAELARLNGLYAALSAVSQAAARASTRQQLLEEVCLALTEYAGFDMAWIGWQDTLAHVLVPLTVQGAEKAYLDGITIRTDDSREGGGPLGRAIRTGQLQVSNELLTDPTMEPWRERARRHGFRSCAAFPIRQGGEVVGGLAVHSSVPQHFQRREIALLEEVASEVSFALDNLHREKRRRATEVLLRDSELRFRTLANSIPQLAWIAHADGRVHWYNDRWFDYTGTTLEEMMGGGWQKVHDPRVLPEVIRTWEEVIASGQPFQMEFPLRRRDGQFRTFLTQVLPMRDADGTLTQW